MSTVTRTARSTTAHAVGYRPDLTDGPARDRLAVLPTKLQPPYQRSGIIVRPRVVDRLRAATSPVVAIIAPAGYGKSTVLSQLDATDGRRLAWLSADARDGDPVTLIRDLAAAIDRVAALSPEDIARISTPGPSVWLSAVPRLAATLTEHPEVTLAIDDIDRLGTMESIDVVLAIAELVRGRGRIVVTGRTFGRLPVPRLVSRGLVSVLDRDDLALDLPETREVLAATGLEVTPLDVRAIAELTEGWAAGTYLRALAVAAGRSDRPSPSDVSPERLIEEYFRTEVLGALSADDVDLLVSASVLDRMSGPLCDALLDRQRSGSDLDRLERTNLFLIPLDEERTWFRFHHLLGDFLRAELERRDPARVTELRRRAAIWHQEQGLIEPALEYAMSAGDEDRAAGLAMAIAQGTLNVGRSETVRRWMHWFDERDIIGRHPMLAAYATMLFALGGDVPAAERWAASFEPWAATLGPDPGTTDAEALGVWAISRVLIGQHGSAGMLADAEIAVAALPDGHPFRVTAFVSLGVSRALTGDADGSTEALHEAIARWEVNRVANTAACLALTQLTAAALARGDRPTAEAYIAKARSIISSFGLMEQAIVVCIDALDARLAMTHGAVEQARSILAHAQRLRPGLTYIIPWVSIRARFDLIKGMLALGDGGGARTLMAEVDEILAVRPDMGTLLDERAELVERLRALKGGRAGASTLTIAELRVLPLLTTHLTFREIGERLFVSQNTVKTQAISIYRKLDATSRNEAIERAIEMGLLESPTTTERFGTGV